MALTHQLLKLYRDDYLNLFDGAVLHLTILASFLPLIEFFDSLNPNLVLGTAYASVLLPLVSLITMKLVIHRRNIRNMIDYCKCKHSRNVDEVALNDCQVQLLREFDIIVDDNMRRNATIADM